VGLLPPDVAILAFLVGYPMEEDIDVLSGKFEADALFARQKVLMARVTLEEESIPFNP
jgi:elongation factor P hydroxylase